VALGHRHAALVELSAEAAGAVVRDERGCPVDEVADVGEVVAVALRGEVVLA
jgi:hypothetical protein